MNTDQYLKMMSLWVESAKACTQLSVAALILPVFFLRNILGLSENTPLGAHLDYWLLGSWGFLGVSIAIGLLYQITATKLMEHALAGTSSNRQLYPELQFQVMTISMYLGLVFFVLGVFFRR